MWVTELSVERAREGQEGAGVHAADHRRHGEGLRLPVPEVRAPRLPCAELRRRRSGSSARATARSTTGSARRRAARRPRSRPLHADVHGRLGHRRHQPSGIVLGPADRHQHHRPRGRGPALRRRRQEGMTFAARHQRDHRMDDLHRHLRRLSSSTRRSTSCAAARPSSVRRSSSRPTASRTCRDEQLEGPKLDRTLTIALLDAVRHRGGPAAVLDPRARPPGRCDDRLPRDVRGARRGDVRAGGHESRRARLRGLPRAEGCRRHHELQPASSPTARCKVVNWRVPALNTVLLRYSPRRGHVHHHVRPTVLADAGVGCRRRWRAQRPAGPEPRRLPPVDPDLARAVPTGGAGTSWRR